MRGGKLPKWATADEQSSTLSTPKKVGSIQETFIWRMNQMQLPLSDLLTGVQDGKGNLSGKGRNASGMK